MPADNAVGFQLPWRWHGVPAELHVDERRPHGVGLALGDPHSITPEQLQEDDGDPHLYNLQPAGP